MFTDMVGYTALGQRNESLSLALVEEQRKLIRLILARHNGKEIKTIGDAFLVEFPNALDSVKCAYDIQRATREFNISMSAEKRIHLRVGLHLGDVVESQGDISGDAVNLASRIEPLAEDGGVCITRQVYDHVASKFELTLTSLGPKTLKNISAPVEVYKMIMPWSEERTISSAQLDAKRIAILPFVNMSPDPNDEYFADGLTEELIDRLSQVKELEVIARTSIMTYKKKEKKAAEIGRELSAGTLVEGSVRKAGIKIRVTAQLINANTEGHLWSSKYDRELQDIFEVQGDIAGQIANALKVQLLPSERRAIRKKATESTEAFALYLKGRYYWNERTESGLTKAIQYFERAIEKDPNYALAYVGLSDSYGILANYGLVTPANALVRAKECAIKALELDGDLAEAHASLALVLTDLWDFKAGGRELKTAIQLNPSYASAHQWYGDYLYDVERNSEEMIKEKLKAQQLDPLSPTTNLNVGVAYFFTHKYDEAISALSKTLAEFPEFYNGHVWMSGVLAHVGRYEESITELEKAESLSADQVTVAMAKGVIYGLWGKTDQAMSQIASLETMAKTRYVGPDTFGFFYSALGRRDEAFQWFNKACEEKTPGLLSVLSQPIVVDKLKADPRWAQLRQRLGLAE